jgi:hypothetical protein
VPVRDDITPRLVRLQGAFGRVFEQAMDWAEEDFRSEIEAVKWGWPGTTKRANGSEAGTRRDIVDLGGLRDSQKREDFGQERTVFVWTGKGRDGEESAYALHVHDGYTSKGGQRMPARPFTDHAISELPSIVETLLVREITTNG